MSQLRGFEIPVLKPCLNKSTGISCIFINRKICIKERECVRKDDESNHASEQKTKQHDFIDFFFDAESADVDVIGNISPTDEGTVDKTSIKVL